MAHLRESAFYVSQTAVRTSRAIVVAACTAISLLAFVGVVESLGPLSGAFAAVCAIAVLALQVGYFSRPRTVLLSPRTAALLVLQVVLVYGPIAEFGTYWLGFPGFVAGNLLLTLPRRWGLAGFVAVVASSVVLELTVGAQLVSPSYAAIYAAVSTTLTGLIVYGLTRMASLVHQLHESRDTLSRMAEAEGRLRLARDAHDVLGMSLSAISLKAELSYRLLPVDPDRARTELDELLQVSRQALTDVRELASGSLNSLSLEQELRSARSVLQAADIEAAVERHGPIPPEATSSLLATILREAVTNVLRHSKAEHCAVTVRAGDDGARLEIVNDGLRPDDAILAGERPTGGNGIGNLERRVGEHGGTFTAGRVGDEFVLAVTLPPERADPPEDDGPG